MSLSIPLFLIFIALAHIAVGTYVLFCNPRSTPHQAVYLFSLGGGLWIGGIGLLVADPSDAYIPLLIVGSMVLLFGLCAITQAFRQPQEKPLSWYWYLPFIFVLYASIHPQLLIHGVTYSSGDLTLIPGPWYRYYAVWFSFYGCTNIYLLFNSYWRASYENRIRLHYFFLGIGLFTVSMVISNIVLPAFGICAELYIGPIASIVSLSAKGYALVKHDLMDIRFMVQRSLVYSMLLSLIIGLYATLIIGIDLFFHASVDARTFLAAGITMVAGIFGVPLIERIFQKATDSIFFRHPYVYSVELERLSEILNANLDFDELIVKSLRELNRILKPTDISFFHHRDGICFDVSGKRDMATCKKNDSVALRVQVESEDVYFGAVLLGEKRSGDRYSLEDQRLLRTFAQHATVALHKAELYQELKEHSELLEERVLERTRHLEALQERQREFFDDVSHALQTPLTVLTSALHLMGRAGNIPPTTLRASMQTSVNTLSGLLRTMLELARIDTLSPVASCASFDLSALVERIVEYVGIAALARGIHVSSDIQRGIAFRGDERQIEELVTNILSNAIRYTEGCPEQAVHITLVCTDGHIALSIKDTGIGIPADQLSRIFERSYRSESADGKARGFGLGLAIAKRITDRHHGSLTIESAPGEGTTARISLPLLESFEEEPV